MGKRKRSGEAPASEAPETKRKATEEDASLSAAKRRQERSERKSKSKSKPESKPHSKSKKKDKDNGIKAVPEEFLPNTEAKEDTFLQGDNFISLDISPDSTSATKPQDAKAPHKTKGRSPRAIRKEKRAESEASKKDTDTVQDTTKPRFIVFVGNLPFSTTTPQIARHFHKLAPASIRHSTDKATGKSKGFAFLEFTDYSAMKTCLKVYHHSNFDPERTAKLPENAFDENGLEIDGPDAGDGYGKKKGTGRRINVELTAGGGGGKSGKRREKIKEKNEKLFEERERRKKEENKTGKTKKKDGGMSEANKTEIGSDAVHPSRLRRVPNQ